MKNHRWVLCLCVLLTILACQQNEKTDNSSETPKIAETPATPSATPDAKVIQKSPLTAYAKQFYATALWHFDAAVVTNDLEKGKMYEGKWIKFNPDNTLTTGFYEEEGTPGSWAIDEGTNILTIVEGGERPTYSEWKVQTSTSSDAIMIWVGTRRFGLNNTQIKLLKYSVKPEKK